MKYKIILTALVSCAAYGVYAAPDLMENVSGYSKELVYELQPGDEPVGLDFQPAVNGHKQNWFISVRNNGKSVIYSRQAALTLDASLNLPLNSPTGWTQDNRWCLEPVMNMVEPGLTKYLYYSDGSKFGPYSLGLPLDCESKSNWTYLIQKEGKYVLSGAVNGLEGFDAVTYLATFSLHDNYYTYVYLRSIHHNTSEDVIEENRHISSVGIHIFKAVQDGKDYTIILGLYGAIVLDGAPVDEASLKKMHWPQFNYNIRYFEFDFSNYLFLTKDAAGFYFWTKIDSKPEKFGPFNQMPFVFMRSPNYTPGANVMISGSNEENELVGAVGPLMDDSQNSSPVTIENKSKNGAKKDKIIPAWSAAGDVNGKMFFYIEGVKYGPFDRAAANIVSVHGTGKERRIRWVALVRDRDRRYIYINDKKYGPYESIVFRETLNQNPFEWTFRVKKNGKYYLLWRGRETGGSNEIQKEKESYDLDRMVYVKPAVWNYIKEGNEQNVFIYMQGKEFGPFRKAEHIDEMVSSYSSIKYDRIILVNPAQGRYYRIHYYNRFDNTLVVYPEDGEVRFRYNGNEQLSCHDISAPLSSRTYLGRGYALSVANFDITPGFWYTFCKDKQGEVNMYQNGKKANSTIGLVDANYMLEDGYMVLYKKPVGGALKQFININDTQYGPYDEASVSYPKIARANETAQAKSVVFRYRTKDGWRLYFNGETDGPYEDIHLVYSINAGEAGKNIELKDLPVSYRKNGKTYLRIFQKETGPLEEPVAFGPARFDFQSKEAIFEFAQGANSFYYINGEVYGPFYPGVAQRNVTDSRQFRVMLWQFFPESFGKKYEPYVRLGDYTVFPMAFGSYRFGKSLRHEITLSEAEGGAQLTVDGHSLFYPGEVMRGDINGEGEGAPRNHYFKRPTFSRFYFTENTLTWMSMLENKVYIHRLPLN